jgi:septum formation protein
VLPRVVLASGSPQRLALLRTLGLEPLVVPSGYEERLSAGEKPEEAVRRLAEGKARACIEQGAHGAADGPALLVAADTVIVIDGDILGKPRDREDALRMLRRLRACEHRVLTGLALALVPSGELDVSLAETRVRFRDLDDEEIHAYLSREDVLGAAGSYRIQGLGILLLDSVQGSWSNIAGLPLELFAARARFLGVRLL